MNAYNKSITNKSIATILLFDMSATMITSDEWYAYRCLQLSNNINMRHLSVVQFITGLSYEKIIYIQMNFSVLSRLYNQCFTPNDIIPIDGSEYNINDWKDAIHGLAKQMIHRTHRTTIDLTGDKHQVCIELE